MWGPVCVGCSELSNKEGCLFALLDLVRRTGAEWEHAKLGDTLKIKDEAQDKLASFCSTSRGWDNFREKQ